MEMSALGLKSASGGKRLREKVFTLHFLLQDVLSRSGPWNCWGMSKKYLT